MIKKNNWRWRERERDAEGLQEKCMRKRISYRIENKGMDTYDAIIEKE